MEGLSEATFNELKMTFHAFLFNIFGLEGETTGGDDDSSKTINSLMYLTLSADAPRLIF